MTIDREHLSRDYLFRIQTCLFRASHKRTPIKWYLGIAQQASGVAISPRGLQAVLARFNYLPVWSSKAVEWTTTKEYKITDQAYEAERINILLASEEGEEVQVVYQRTRV